MILLGELSGISFEITDEKPFVLKMVLDLANGIFTAVKLLLVSSRPDKK